MSLLVSGRAHLREALLRHEESQRLHRMCRELKGKAALAGVLKKSHSRALEAYTASEEEDDFRELLDPPHILGISTVLHFFHKNQHNGESLFLQAIKNIALVVRCPSM
jgi:hypothetical protein